MPLTDMFWGDRFGKLEDPSATSGASPPTGRRVATRAGRAREIGDGEAEPGRRLMREIHVSAITDAVKKLCMEANWSLEPDMLRAFDRALGTERSAAGKQC